MATVWAWAAGTVSYLILTGSTDADEICVALLLGALGAVWHAAVLRCDARSFAFDRRALGEIGRAVAGLPGATLRVGSKLVAAIAHGEAGRQVEVPFDVGRRGLPTETGRRAVVTLAASLSPDSYVLRIPAGEGRLQVHALTARTAGGDRRWPT